MSSTAPAPAFKLKIRGPGGDKLIANELNKNSTLGELQQRLEREFGIPTNQQEVSTTYPPPIRVLTGDSSASLASLKIQSSDILILKKIDPPTTTSTQSTQVAPSSTPSSTNPPRRPTSPPKPKPASLESLSHLQPLQVIHMPDDNSCLFNSISFLMEGAYNPELMHQMREIVASVILSDSEQRYDEAILGCSKEEYTKTMLKSESWGGGIELSILAEYYNVEIASLDVESCHQYLFGSVDQPNQRKSNRIYVVYSGVHYDCMVEPIPNQPPRRIFPSTNELIEQRALLTTRQLQAQGAFTNVSAFTLRCSNCKQGLIGAHEAQVHAKATGHQQFEEYQKK